MDDLEVRRLRYFVAGRGGAALRAGGRAARHGAAAAAPAIRDLERQLGVRLLERTTRQVALTAAGAVLAPVTVTRPQESCSPAVAAFVRAAVTGAAAAGPLPAEARV